MSICSIYNTYSTVLSVIILKPTNYCIRNITCHWYPKYRFNKVVFWTEQKESIIRKDIVLFDNYNLLISWIIINSLIIVNKNILWKNIIWIYKNIISNKVFGQMQWKIYQKNIVMNFSFEKLYYFILKYFFSNIPW